MKCNVCGAKTEAFLCTDCGHRLAAALGDLPSLLDALLDRAAGNTHIYRANNLTPRRDDELAGLEAEYAAHTALLPVLKRSRDGRITLPATPLPVDLDASRLLHEARNTLTTCIRDLTETRGLDAPTERLPTVVIADVHVSITRNRWHIIREPRIVRVARDRPMEDLTAWLLTNIDTIRYDEAGRETYTQLLALNAKITRAVDRSPADSYAGPCAHCSVDMWRRAGTDQIICDARYYVLSDAGQLETARGCGMTYTLAQRQRWLLDAVRDELVALDMLQDFMRSLGRVWPPSTTVASWRLRRRLDVRSIDRHGVELFRGGDVLDLHEDWLVKQAEKISRQAS
ncbi:MAG TPA: hypothetical protein VHZ96_26250 [Frankiaceae bacterium]|nr:hypothetical protein [Frankiaceae bacterium]